MDPMQTLRGKLTVTGFKSGGLIQTDSNQTESAQTVSDSVPRLAEQFPRYLVPASTAAEYSSILADINASPWVRKPAGDCGSSEVRCNLTE